MAKEYGTRELIGLCARMASMLAWSIIAIAHLLALHLIALAMWWFHVTPEAVASAARDMLDATWWKVAGGVGLTAAGLSLGYWRFVRWVHRRPLGAWLRKRLLSIE
jgi:hypothetical protein